VSPDLLVALDREGAIRAANPAWQRVLGWRRHELVGRCLADLLHPADLDRAGEVLRTLGCHELVSDVEVRLRHRDGGWRWISWASSGAARSGRIIASGRDVQAEPFLRQREAAMVRSC
jgi:PAS domain S-box-containing protein